jgi:hypothetical protein
MTLNLETGKITIEYCDGRTIQGFVLARHGNTMSVAVRGADDAALFTCVHGTWVSEDCEPVAIRFEWQRHAPAEAISEADCICSKELAARLISALVGGDEPECEGNINYEQPLYAPMFAGSFSKLQ